MSITTGGRRYLAWLGTESGYQPLRADLGTLTGYTEISRHRRREVVQITLGTSNQARDALRAALADRGMDYQTVTEIPFEIELVGSGSARAMFFGCSSLTYVPDMDTSNVTDMQTMLYGCSSLTHVPDLDTSSVTSMSNMFNGCSSLTHAPAMDTSSVTSMYRMFLGCSSLTYVPDMDTSSVTDMRNMFQYCLPLTDGGVRLIGKHPDVRTTAMIANSGLTREPFFDTNGNPI